MRIIIGLIALFISVQNCSAQPIPNARLSLTNQPGISDVVGATVLHYTDGIGTDLTYSVSGLAVASYDVAVNSGVISTSAFNPARSDPNYVGSINLSVAGQLTTNMPYGKARGWGVWNAYNQKEISLQVGIPGPAGSYAAYYLNASGDTYPTWQLFGTDPASYGVVFTGLPVPVDIEYVQQGFLTWGPTLMIAGIGWNSTTFASGEWGQTQHDDANTVTLQTARAHYVNLNALGANKVQMLVMGRGNVILYGGEGRSTLATQDRMSVMRIKWKG